MTYVLSDIHGNLARYESIMTQINLQPDDTLWRMSCRAPGNRRIVTFSIPVFIMRL